jgi:hypothetical protein
MAGNSTPGWARFLYRERDITAASISVGSSDLTVTLSVSGTGKFDTLTISGLQVQALDGLLDLAQYGYILNLSANPELR